MTRLPTDLWARVASFLPFDALIPTFWALRRAGMLPATHTTPSQSLLQFCSQCEQPEDAPQSHDLEPHFHATLCEWFTPEMVAYSVQLCDGQPDRILEYLLHVH